MNNKGLDRFKEAQRLEYQDAVTEIEFGEKVGHWMWFVFHQLIGLGLSSTSETCGIQSFEQAHEYWEDPILDNRMMDISRLVLKHRNKPIDQIFGFLDAVKFKSSITLFYLISEDDLFKIILDTFFDGGELCEYTLIEFNKWNSQK